MFDIVPWRPNIEAGEIDVTAFGRIGILHVDDDDGRFRRLERDRLGRAGSVTLFVSSGVADSLQQRPRSFGVPPASG